MSKIGELSKAAVKMKLTFRKTKVNYLFEGFFEEEKIAIVKKLKRMRSALRHSFCFN